MVRLPHALLRSPSARQTPLLKKTKPEAPASDRPRASNQFLLGLKTAAIASSGFVCALVLWEVILRSAVEKSQGVDDHPALGKIDNAGVMIHTREGFNRTTLNSLGMRAPEPTPKQPGEYRILLLGDSFTRADEVSDGLSFSDRLQTHFVTEYKKSNRLQYNPSDQFFITAGQSRQITEKVSVVNAGKPSASPAGYLFASDFHREKFEPNATVIQLTEHDFTMDMGDESSEFYLKKTDDTYKAVRNKKFGSADPLAQLVTEKVPQLRSLFTLSTLRIGGRNLSAALSSSESDTESTVKRSKAEEAKLQAEDAAMIDWTLKQLDEKFPNVVIVFIPAMSYLDAGPTSSVSRNAAIEKRLTESAKSQGIPLINMRQDFRNHYAKEDTYLKGFSNTLPGEGHLNAHGHRLVARRLINFFSQPNSPLRQS